MVMCVLTVVIGLAILAAGIGGSLRIGMGHGMVISGVVGGVILVLGLFGIGC